MTFELNWGVMGPGRISVIFIEDLLHSKDKGRTALLKGEIKHNLVAVASSSSQERSEQFKEKVHEAGNESIKAYGSYAEIYADKNVDIVYIGTPNLNHYTLCKEALEHGKHVLLEKPFTINHLQAEALAKLARDKKLFLMEAYWAKFIPVYRDVEDYLFQEKCPIGPVKRIVSDLSYYFPREDPLMERIYSPKLGGGCALDIGIYAFYWPLGFLDKDNKQPFPSVKADAVLTDTGVDINTGAVIQYANGTLGVCTCSGEFTNQARMVVINCTKGRVEVDNSNRPNEFWVYDADNKVIAHKRYEYDGMAMFFEADHVAQCLAKGLTESPLHSLEHCIRMSKLLDEVRRQTGVVYPAELEKL